MLVPEASAGGRVDGACTLKPLTLKNDKKFITLPNLFARCHTIFSIDLDDEPGSSLSEPITIEDKPPVAIDVRSLFALTSILPNFNYFDYKTILSSHYPKWDHEPFNFFLCCFFLQYHRRTYLRSNRTAGLGTG